MKEPNIEKLIDFFIVKGFQSIKNIDYNPLAEFIPYVTSKEVVHTKILKEILSYENNAVNFINYFLKKEVPNDIKINVFKERKVQSVLTGLNDRSIDLCITWEDCDKNKHSVIIENKLNNANFQERQMEDYLASITQNKNEKVEASIIIYKSKNKVIDKENKYILISPEELAEWVKSIANKNVNLLAYANYLFDLNKINIDMRNSEKLLGCTLEEIKELDLLTQAFSKLNESKNHYIVSRIREIHENISYEWGKLDEGAKMLQIWNPDDYQRNDLWIAIYPPSNPADDEQGTDIYVYTHAKKSEGDYEKITAGLSDSNRHYQYKGSQEGYAYFRDEKNFRFQFFDKDKKEAMITEIIRLLDKIHEIK